MIKYICDICGQEVYEIEALGPGVMQNYPDNPSVGKEYKYLDETGAELYVAIRRGDDSHFCKACMWKIVRRMLDDFGPRVVEIDDLKRIMPNEETDSGTTEPDSQLHELYAEGTLPTPGPDADSDTPGLYPRPNDVPNSDDSDRTGWKHPRRI